MRRWPSHCVPTTKRRPHPSSVPDGRQTNGCADPRPHYVPVVQMCHGLPLDHCNTQGRGSGNWLVKWPIAVSDEHPYSGVTYYESIRKRVTMGPSEGKQRIACWIHDQLAVGDLFTDRKQGRPLSSSLQVAVETDDGLYLIVPSKGHTGEHRVSVYNIRASILAGEQRNKLFQVTPGTNPFPGVGDPVYPGGPVATKSHAVTEWAHSTTQAGVSTVTGRSPLQQAREVLDGLSKTKVVALVTPPPVAVEAGPPVIEQIGHLAQSNRPAQVQAWGTPATSARSALAPPSVPVSDEAKAAAEVEAASHATMRPISTSQQKLAVTLRKTGVNKGLRDPDAQEPNRLINWSHR
jgi:hypothetical protein